MLLRFLLALVVLCFFSCPRLYGQEKFAFGGTWDTLIYDQIPLIPSYVGAKNAATPNSVNLRPFCPRPGNQDTIGSCVGFAMGYGAMTILEAIRRKTDRPEIIADFTFSASFVYNQIKPPSSNCRSGSSVTKALSFLQERGNCFSKDFEAPTDCNTQPTDLLVRKALQHRMKGGGAIFDRHVSGPEKVAIIKEYLADSIPVVVHMEIFRSFLELPSGNGFWLKRQYDEFLDHHCMLVVGYDDNRQAFELLNSWGQHWADRGFAQISYKDMMEYCLGGYIILPKEPVPRWPSNSSNIPADLEGTEQFTATGNAPSPIESQQPHFYLQGAFQFLRIAEGFKNVEPVYWSQKEQLYLTQRNSFPVGTLFQLETQDIPRGKYVYIFSVNPEEKVQIHWPKQTERTLSNLVPRKNLRITIPSQRSALRLDMQGSSFLCILYAEDPVLDIKARLQRLEKVDYDNFLQGFNNVFKPYRIPPGKINYDHKRMFFSCRSTMKQGTLVPLILHIEGAPK